MLVCCMCLFVAVLLSVRVVACMYAQIFTYACTRKCMYIRRNVCENVSAQRACIFACLRVSDCTHVRYFACMHVCMSACTSVCLCMHVCMCVWETLIAGARVYKQRRHSGFPGDIRGLISHAYLQDSWDRRLLI